MPLDNVKSVGTVGITVNCGNPILKISLVFVAFSSDSLSMNRLGHASPLPDGDTFLVNQECSEREAPEV